MVMVTEIYSNAFLYILQGWTGSDEHFLHVKQSWPEKYSFWSNNKVSVYVVYALISSLKLGFVLFYSAFG